jgi:hypothetical protein
MDRNGQFRDDLARSHALVGPNPRHIPVLRNKHPPLWPSARTEGEDGGRRRRRSGDAGFFGNATCETCGGRYRTRTDDLFRVKEARYQLRQSPEPFFGACQSCHSFTPTAVTARGFSAHQPAHRPQHQPAHRRPARVPGGTAPAGCFRRAVC